MPNSSIKIEKLAQIDNPTSIHGIYPYRGKISARDAGSMVSQLSPGKVLLDPFCGSGTIVYEGHRAGLESIGFDTNPLAIWLSKGKLNLAHSDIDEILEEAKKLIKGASGNLSNKPMPEDAARHFHRRTASEIMTILPFAIKSSDYIKACFFGSIALAARGCNHYKWTSSTVGKDINPKRYINFYEKFLYKIKKHYFPLNNSVKSRVYQEDSRNLSRFLKKGSVDYIFTSPPYFDALDYTAYYAKIIYSILGMDRNKIKGLLIQNNRTYRKDMETALNEVLEVTHDQSLIIFVVGDKKVGDKVINGGEFFSKLLKHPPTQFHERSYTNSSSQVFDALNGTKRKEQIVVWDRRTW